jgi:hypothetical protein
MTLRSPLRTCHEVTVEANHVMGNFAIKFHSVLLGMITDAYRRDSQPRLVKSRCYSNIC